MGGLEQNTPDPSVWEALSKGEGRSAKTPFGSRETEPPQGMVTQP